MTAAGNGPETREAIDVTTTLGPAPTRHLGRLRTGPAKTKMLPGGIDTEHRSAAEWLFRSPAASLIWLFARVWLGYQWANAGYQKIWGSERMGFWFNNGAGVKGFATGGVAASHGATASVAYGWWAGFLHNFVTPNSGWIAKLVAISELTIGIALILGLFTGLAALGAVTLNLTYMLSGVAGVNPIYALIGIGLVLAWRNAGDLGLDRFALPAIGTPFKTAGEHVRRLIERRTPITA
jgi:thiosulfate dehydrogenase [quinone] large subunit